MKFNELEKLMDKVSKTPISESDKNYIAKLGAEVKENSLEVETYHDLVEFTKSLEHLVWYSGTIQTKILSGKVGI